MHPLYYRDEVPCPSKGNGVCVNESELCLPDSNTDSCLEDNGFSKEAFCEGLRESMDSLDEPRLLKRYREYVEEMSVGCQE